MRRSSTVSSWRQPFRADIQGLRALAVLLVLLYHAGLPFLDGGFVGVDIFFVISGFLITNHLLAELSQHGRIRLGEFYARRARRILPASFVVLLLTLVVGVAVIAPLDWAGLAQDVVATALYAPNLLFAWQGTDYLSGQTPSLVQHYWSLGIEEQFYLLWPIALWGLMLLSRSSRRRLLLAIALLSAASLVACVVLTSQSQPWAFFGLPTRAWELGAGGLLAAFLAGRQAPGGRLVAAVGSWSGLLGLLAIAFLFDDALLFPGIAAALPVAATVAIILFAHAAGAWGPARVLSSRPLVFIGTISYSLYLVHWPLLQLPAQADGMMRELPLWLTLGIAAVSMPIAYLLHRWVEVPAQRWRPLAASRPRRSLLVALAVSLVVVAMAGAGAVASRVVPDTAVASVEADAFDDPPESPSFVPANVEPDLREAKEDNPAIYADGCHFDYAEVALVDDCTYGSNGLAPLVALFGDSHAAQWFPALQGLADRGVLRVVVYTKSACPSADVDRTLQGGQPYDECEAWREGVLDEIGRVQPSAVIVANSSAGIAPSTWEKGLAKVLDEVDDVSTPVVIADTPRFPFDPVVCASANVEDLSQCTVPVEEALSAPHADAEEDAAEGNGGYYLDLNGYLCTDVCGPIVESALAYRDEHHLTATLSAELADALEEGLEDAQVLAETPSR